MKRYLLSWFLLITLATVRLSVSYGDSQHHFNFNLEGEIRARPVLPRLGLARQASIDAVQTRAHGGPPG